MGDELLHRKTKKAETHGVVYPKNLLRLQVAQCETRVVAQLIKKNGFIKLFSYNYSLVNESIHRYFDITIGITIFIAIFI